MIEWIVAEGTGHYYFFAFPICLIILLIILKKRRVSFLVPSIIITVVIVNPWFYKIWNNYGLYAYWRILWIIPVIPVVAAVAPAITEKIGYRKTDCDDNNFDDKKTIMQTKSISIKKCLIIICCVSLIILGGSFVYALGSDGQFSFPAENSAKLPEYVVQIADRLLSDKEHPRIIAEDPIGVYIRQYTGEINILFGRDIRGYILNASSTAKEINKKLASNEFGPISEFMLNDNYDYLVINDTIGTRKQQMIANGFELVDTIAGYGIYKPQGKPTEIKTRNELGQITSVTYINEDGIPINGKAGYATVTYEYDYYDHIIREFHMDTEQKGVANNEGCAGYEREYDDNSHIIMHRTIDQNGLPVSNQYGYAEIKREYKGQDLIEERYYDEKGELVDRNDIWYAEIRMEYDEKHHLTSEQYYNAVGEATDSVTGYAGKKNTYDEAGHMTSETYYGIDGCVIDCINGYASVEYEYDDMGKVILQRFRNASGNMVVTGSGYAEVHRKYEDNHLVLEEYFDAEGEPYYKPAGYTAIEQVWDGDTLVNRIYLDENNQIIDRNDGYSEVVWAYGETSTSIMLFNLDGNQQEEEGINLARDVQYDSDGWSSWLFPRYNTKNSCKNIGYLNLGEKQEGDIYTCYIEIEYKGVTASEGQEFYFCSQGAQDDKWITENIWNNRLVYLNEPPADGIYTYVSTVVLAGDMLNISTFNIGFRCDYWKSGYFRVRKVKIEKGDFATEWSSGI